MNEINNDHDFLDAINQNCNVILNFYSKKCAPCMQLYDYINNISSINIKKYNIDARNKKNKKIIKLLEIKYVPTVIIFNCGSILSKIDDDYIINIEKILPIKKNHYSNLISYC